MYQQLSTHNLWYHEPKVKLPSILILPFNRQYCLVIFSQRVQKPRKLTQWLVPKSMPGHMALLDNLQWTQGTMTQIGNRSKSCAVGSMYMMGTMVKKLHCALWTFCALKHSVNQLCTGHFVHSAQPSLGSGSNNCAPTAGRATGSDLASDLRCPKTPTLPPAPCTLCSYFAF